MIPGASRLVSPREAASSMGISVRAVLKLCERGRLRGARKIGAGWVIPVDRAGLPIPKIKREPRGRRLSWTGAANLTPAGGAD